MARAGTKVVRLSPTQVRVLHVLADNPDGLSRTQIAESVDTPSAVYLALGPVERGEFGEHDVRYGRRSLHSLGYVKVLKDEDLKGHDTYIWQITAKGEDAAEKYRARKTLDPDSRIPDDILVPVVKKIRHTRSYGFENYSSDDIAEIRGMIPTDYRDTETESLRTQIINLRKLGKLSEKQVDSWPLWYREYRESEHWQEVESEFKDYSCAVNRSHTGDDVGLELIHADIVVIGRESAADVITLCKDCRKRLKASLVKIPTDIPVRAEA